MTTPKKTAITSSQPIRKVPFRFKELVITLGHFCLGLFILVSLFAAAQQLTGFYSLSIPPAILGIAALFITLVALNCIPKAIMLAARPLLGHMSLFFLPAIVAIVNYVDLVRLFPVALLLAIVITTLITLAITGLFAQWLMHSFMADPLKGQPKTTTKNHND